MLARAHKPFSVDRSVVLLGVIGLHVAGVYLVSVYGGFRALVENTARALTVVTVPEDPRPDVAAPPPPPPTLQRPQAVDLPEPIFDFGADAAPGEGAITTVRVEQPHATPGEVARVPVIPPTPLSYRSRRSTDEYYPPASIRMAEQGVAVVRVCVGAGGELQGVPQVEQTSGHPRLDAAAVSWAREALTFTPARENGVPVAACKGFRVRFALR